MTVSVARPGGHTPPRTHGGPDGVAAAAHDFSTCANAAGPCPQALRAVRSADPTRYPDPQGTALRLRLARRHGVAPERVLLAASASEFIQRITAMAARLGVQAVQVPRLAYGDYAAAAQACGLGGMTDTRHRVLRWCADPASPTGHTTAPPADAGRVPTVLDAVYAPLRLRGRPAWPEQATEAVFVLHSPNKALGLCGVRGAYVIAPSASHEAVDWPVSTWTHALEACAPSWPLSAQGVAMLEAWCEDEVLDWVTASRTVLAHWTESLRDLLRSEGCTVFDSDCPFFVVRPPVPVPAQTLRRHGVAVRDTASFGLAGHWRVSAQPPASLHALRIALHAAWRDAERQPQVIEAEPT
ncbi:MAG: aminotransferase class I/II-fold pyridoxal phosphate-dependent enzyme [Aquabacterium sp.]|jgi:histidinol-phosphate aminotransferase|nr:aminotransferase class I/II-fold pyridoxal phosphate-dependent enzyme [Aquabacterium sp.]